MASAADPTTVRSIGFRAVQRRIAEALANGPVADPESASLESQRFAVEGPRMADAEPIEQEKIVRRVIAGDPEVGFAAFLDGMQLSRIVAHDDGIPIVFGEVGAVIRERVERRLATWREERATRLYAPLGFLSGAVTAAVSDGLPLSDTTPRTQTGEPDHSGLHPLSLTDVAVHAVQEHREALELSLAEAWINQRGEPLYVDGGISGSSRVAAATNAVGVVKTHRTLYGDAAAVRVILALEAGERSSVFAVAPGNGWRSTVASWYLRLRKSADPLWGLVRVEMNFEKAALTQRADQISRWILAEMAPLALPDARWDTMAYGIRDCQQYLKATLR
jgi:hypothetical protein